VKTVSHKVVKHSFAYLSGREMIGGNVLFYVKIVGYGPIPLAKRRFSMHFRSLHFPSAVTPSKKVQLTLIGSPLSGSLRLTSYVVPKPPTPKGAWKPQNGRFPCKIALAWRKSAKVSLYENR